MDFRFLGDFFAIQNGENSFLRRRSKIFITLLQQEKIWMEKHSEMVKMFRKAGIRAYTSNL